MPEMSQRVSEAKRRQTTDKLAVERVRGAKVAWWKALENDGKRTIRARHVEYFCQEGDGLKRFREQAEEEKQAAMRVSGS